MYLLTLDENPNEGAYAVADRYGEKVLFLFQKEDDAERYAMQIEEQEENKAMRVIEVEDNLAIITCRRYNYKYAVITPNDIIIPPKIDDNFSKN
tara:strand:- start:228 stop:509 length:282 start_codon:yes stop_codon:yes gene_type:complete